MRDTDTPRQFQNIWSLGKDQFPEAGDVTYAEHWPEPGNGPLRGLRLRRTLAGWVEDAELWVEPEFGPN